MCTLLLCTALASACRSVTPNRSPFGERFPDVQATALDGRVLSLPDELAGAPAVLLVGYVMDTQFDLDRWLVGLMQLGSPVKRVEVPTIDGLVPGLIAGSIDDGMRAGIPSEDWAAVATVYQSDAARIVAFTGDERPRNGRVLLIDREGVVRWFHDRGFSPSKLAELDRLARELASDGTQPSR
ncbi:MAG: hypothetical protein K8S98_05730 [Planctomycetes bacterium]|nr:hypothetical protein [Planctomycetota bacterium]